MAKSARASVKKTNRSKLRANVFQRVEDERTKRLHEKLLATVQQPKPEQAIEKQKMDIDSENDKVDDGYPKEMDVDGASSSSKPFKKVNKSKLKRRQKPRNQISFPLTRGKGALKPFSGSRVQKRR